MNCDYCHSEASADAAFCPACGTRFAGTCSHAATTYPTVPKTGIADVTQPSGHAASDIGGAGLTHDSPLPPNSQPGEAARALIATPASCADANLSPDRTAAHYAAFISYRHLPLDAKAAKYVQRAIETFRLPKVAPEDDESESAADRRGLRQSCGLRQNCVQHHSRTLGKCFRDEDELSASHSLPAHIDKALAQSTALVVICTPDTVKSPWVLREITRFAELHGRERIFAVLASGSSKESIPECLRWQKQPDGRGGTERIPAEPLAADLRVLSQNWAKRLSPSSRRKIRTELLRLIASIAGCDYDDLQQRTLRRQRRKHAIGAAAAAAVCAALVFTGARAYSAHQQSLQQESLRLAEASAQLMAQGDRYGAIETALSALPEHGSSRPFVTEAQEALEQALLVNPDPATIWRPSFTFDAAASIVDLASHPDGDWFALLTDNLILHIANIYTGNVHCTVSLPELLGISITASEDSEDESNRFPELEGHSHWHIEAVDADHLIVVSDLNAQPMACLDTTSGALTWSYGSVTIDSLAVSPDGASLFALSVFPQNLMFAQFDTKTGEVLTWGNYDNPGIVDFGRLMPAAYNPTTNSIEAAFGGVLMSIDVEENGSCSFRPIHSPLITDVACYGADTLLAAFDSSGGNSSDPLVDYSFESSVDHSLDSTFDPSLDEKEEEALTASKSEPDGPTSGFVSTFTAVMPSGEILWNADGQLKAALTGGPYDSVAHMGIPKVQGFIEGENPLALCSSGSQIYALSVTDGTIAYQGSYASAVEAVDILQTGAGGPFISVVTSDGAMSARSLPLLEISGDSTMTENLPAPVSSASISWYQGSELIILGISETYPERLFAYHLDADINREYREYSLEELIDEAHRQLDEHYGTHTGD